MTPRAGEAMAKRFHELYEQLAPQFGYETRPETREFDPESPNGRLMIAVCAALSFPPQSGEAVASEPIAWALFNDGGFADWLEQSVFAERDDAEHELICVEETFHDSSEHGWRIEPLYASPQQTEEPQNQSAAEADPMVGLTQEGDPIYASERSYYEAAEEADYAEAEREHLGDPEAGTGIYYRPTTPAENLRILAMRLSEHLSPAEKRELEEAAVILETPHNKYEAIVRAHFPERKQSDPAIARYQYLRGAVVRKEWKVVAQACIWNSDTPEQFDSEVDKARCAVAGLAARRESALPSAKEAKEPAVSQWIPVSERLPEEGQCVLVYCPTQEFMHVEIDEWKMFSESPLGYGASVEVGLMWANHEYEDITHWTPLPAAPSTNTGSKGSGLLAGEGEKNA